VRPASRAFWSSAGLAVSRLARAGRPRHGVRILYYHSIGDTPVRSSVSPGAFEAQIGHLVRAGYALLSLSEATARLASRAPLSPRSVVITLDDGFRDNYEHAFPILARFGVRATVFLTVSYIGTDRLPTLTRTEFMPQPLSWEQVKEMHAQGIEFGSHTLTHPMLSQVSPDVARREIAESRRQIEDRLGVPARFFCYPRGDYNAAVKRMVKEEGYAAACTTRPGVSGWRTDPYELRRTYVSRQDTPGEFAKKVDGAYDLLQEAARRWQLLRRR
jgi:peptidoglycan/xylan/chitin deacetylase (PgdA/CDA1 family)